MKAKEIVWANIVMEKCGESVEKEGMGIIQCCV